MWFFLFFLEVLLLAVFLTSSPLHFLLERERRNRAKTSINKGIDDKKRIKQAKKLPKRETFLPKKSFFLWQSHKNHSANVPPKAEKESRNNPPQSRQV
ncbi:MAG: hypothetical protein SPJ29_02510 [Phocaeicola sp.]|nr:hypothetical protein [Phocaeicola sp.]MDY5938617.1 hypothetical protein [Phocaeicola sp.]